LSSKTASHLIKLFGIERIDVLIGPRPHDEVKLEHACKFASSNWHFEFMHLVDGCGTANACGAHQAILADCLREILELYQRPQVKSQRRAFDSAAFELAQQVGLSIVQSTRVDTAVVDEAEMHAALNEKVTS